MLTDNATEEHAGDKGQRHRPNGAAASLCGPETNGDHRAKMVNPGQRMTNTMREPTGFANSDMRMGDGRNENRRENRHHESLNFHVKMTAEVACFVSGRGLRSRRRDLPRAGQSAHHGQLVKMHLRTPAKARVDLQAQAWSLKQGHESVHCVRKFDRP
jgi:hypothetical protein